MHNNIRMVVVVLITRDFRGQEFILICIRVNLTLNLTILIHKLYAKIATCILRHYLGITQHIKVLWQSNVAEQTHLPL